MTTRFNNIVSIASQNMFPRTPLDHNSVISRSGVNIQKRVGLRLARLDQMRAGEFHNCIVSISAAQVFSFQTDNQVVALPGYFFLRTLLNGLL